MTQWNIHLRQNGFSGTENNKKVKVVVVKISSKTLSVKKVSKQINNLVYKII